MELLTTQEVQERLRLNLYEFNRCRYHDKRFPLPVPSHEKPAGSNRYYYRTADIDAYQKLTACEQRTTRRRYRRAADGFSAGANLVK